MWLVREATRLETGRTVVRDNKENESWLSSTLEKGVIRERPEHRRRVGRVDLSRYGEVEGYRSTDIGCYGPVTALPFAKRAEN